MLKRRDEKILELKEQVKENEKLQQGLNKATTRVKSYQYKLGVSKSKCDTISESVITWSQLLRVLIKT